jgi:tetratricopeptide (TPR) repeat protein
MKDSTEALLKRAFELANTGDLDGALKYAEKAVATDPSEPGTHNDKAFILQALGKFDEALAEYRECLKVSPEYLNAYRGIAVIQINLGKLDEAEATINEWIEKNPNDPLTYQHMAVVKKFGEADLPLLQKVQTCLAQIDDANTQSELHFVLGKMFNDMGKYDEAFNDYQKGNEIFSSLISYDEEKAAMQSYLDSHESVFNKDFFEQYKGAGNDSNTPIFIIGMPRSGTTLIEQVLSSHPDVFGGGELTLAGQIAASAQHIMNSSIAYPSCLQTSTADFYGQVSKEYLEQLGLVSGGSKFVVDKMPDNFWHLGLLYLLFPNAKFIHCRRNPLDIGLSLYFNKFAQGNNYSYDFKNIAAYFGFYKKMMKLWENTLPTQILTLDYEDFVDNPESNSRKLLDFCDIEWDNACLEPHKAKGAIRTGSAWQARQPIYKTSKERWRNYEKYIEPLKKALALAG